MLYINHIDANGEVCESHDTLIIGKAFLRWNLEVLDQLVHPLQLYELVVVVSEKSEAPSGAS